MTSYRDYLDKQGCPRGPWVQREGRVPSEPGSREPSPAVSALSGFDPSRGMVLEHYAEEPLSAVYTVSQEREGEEKDWHWRGKPKGLWVSVLGENDWAEWCEAESFGIKPLRHIVTLAPGANVLWVTDLEAFDAFHAKFSRPCKLSPTSKWAKQLIEWSAVAACYDGIVIAPYRWERRLDGNASDWYYGWDCASGVIWNAGAVEAIAMEARKGGDDEAGSVRSTTARAEGIAQGQQP